MSTKRRLPRMRPAVAGVLISAGATLFVATTAFRLAYAGSKGAAGDAGLNPSDASWYPLCIEGVLVVAAVATVVLRSPYPWVVLLGFSALSIGANVQHAVDQPGKADWFMLLVAAVPPAALPLCVELSIRIVKKLTTRDPAAVTADYLAAAALAAHLHWLTRKTTPASSSSNRPVEDTLRDADAAGPGGGTHLTPGPARDTGGVGAPADPSGPDPVTLTPDPVHGDPADPDPVTPPGEPVHGSTGSPGHRAVNLDRLTEDQLVTHFLTRSTPTLTLDQLATRLNVSRSTAKRRVNAARNAAAPLRVVR